MGRKSLVINPLAILIISWGVVFYLHSIKISELLSPFSDIFIVNILGMLVFSIVCYAFGLLTPLKRLNPPKMGDEEVRSHEVIMVVKRIFTITVIIFLITVIFFGGAPLPWLILGIGKTYTEFGFPTLHGLFNALLIFLGSITFWFISSGRSFPAGKYILTFCILVPIISLHRQSLVSLFLQCMFIHAALRVGKNLKAAKGALIFLIVVGVIFSMLGNIRTGNDVLISQASSDGYTEIPASLLWIFLYVTTPISNFHDLTQITISHTLGISSISSLTPTFIRELIWGERNSIMQDFTALTFNAYSYAFIPYLDFGWLGVYLFTGLTVFFATLIYRRYIVTGNLYYLLKLAIVNQIIFLFIFSNLFLTWGIIFQFIVLRILKKRIFFINAMIKNNVVDGRHVPASK